MPGLTNYVRIKVLNSVFRGANFTLQGQTFVNLFTSAPTTDGTSAGGALDGVEWSLGRVEVTPSGSPSWTPAALGDLGGADLSNASKIEWDASTTSALTENTRVVAAGVWDLNDNLLAWDYLERPVYAVPGLPFEFALGDFKLRTHKEIE